MKEQETTLSEEGFTVSTPLFSGSLSDLAHALRSGKLEPQAVNVLELVRHYLAYYAEVAKRSLELATETLPTLARVIELKTRLLLPKPPKETDEEEELETTLEAVTLLEELEEAVQFLKHRREERRIIMPAKAPRPDYPRKERPLKTSLGRLAELASRYNVSSYFELAVERLTMASAMKGLLNAVRRLRHGLLSDLADPKGWPSLVMHFAGMLELIKEGEIKATQAEPYGAIEVSEAEQEEVLEVA